MALPVRRSRGGARRHQPLRPRELRVECDIGSFLACVHRGRESDTVAADRSFASTWSVRGGLVGEGIAVSQVSLICCCESSLVFVCAGGLRLRLRAPVPYAGRMHSVKVQT